MDRILSLLTARHGFDFAGYRRSSLERRIRTRAQVLGLPHFADYVDYLRAQPTESRELLDTLFVNVTSFFRDPDVWVALARASLRRLKARADSGQPIRIWNPGCATGEETYTLLMVLEKTLGADLLRKRVHVIATDMDEPALASARRGVYQASQLEAVPPALRATYFRFSEVGYEFRADLRALVRFHEHDLVHQFPVPRPDLIVCRNTLMYFDARIRRRVLERFCDVLADGGQLVTGRPELLFAHGDLFGPVDLQARIFERRPPNSAGIGG